MFIESRVLRDPQWGVGVVRASGHYLNNLEISGVWRRKGSGFFFGGGARNANY